MRILTDLYNLAGKRALNAQLAAVLLLTDDLDTVQLRVGFVPALGIPIIEQIADIGSCRIFIDISQRIRPVIGHETAVEIYVEG